ncbi:50S ribosomal protein L11 methyltransferase [Streptomyces sp. NBC_01443]|uniref:50S ribosomal protein L11 methyltransferase n=1 Tax=Streptomyces sp. NBC_01443 TaxID=2903868 RepID=UPI00225602ED|nr:50S ribosomal protein L11 methyltransferase [Streptomyces sp. NBC_01443]MCX4632909.1 50S ribosomal protein L11 methyltransferase [Streptomyces sp. NBC_01443]
MREVREIEVDGDSMHVLVCSEPERPDKPSLWPSLGEYPIYDPHLYATMTTDEERNKRFRSALGQLAPGKHVVDIGTGQDLLWARESVQAGARQVTAIEVVDDAFRQAAVNLPSYDVQDRVTLLLGESTSLEFAPKADVCVAEIIGSLASAEGAAAVLTDARRRHLAPDGMVVPHRAVTQAAAGCLADILGEQHVAFAAESIPYLQSIFNWNTAPFDVRLRVENASPAALVSDSAVIESLDFNGTLHTAQETTTRLTVQRPGRIDGVLTWLQLWCLPDEDPLDALRMETNWAAIYFPLFEAPVPVEPGDSLNLTFGSTLSADGVHPDYQLSATLRTAGGHAHQGSLESPHRGGPFRAQPAYRFLFPAA